MEGQSEAASVLLEADVVVGDDEMLVVPRRADPPPRTPFPVIGSLAPLGVAVIVWFVLHSPLALVFALLSPVMAIASLVDGRFSARKARRRDDAEVARRRLVFGERVDVLHAREIATLNQHAPSAHSILERTVNPFTATAAGQPRVSLGLGAVKSGIRVEGGTDDDDDDARRLRAAALVLSNAPVLAPSPSRIAVAGEWPLADALARGYAVQLAAAISPDAAVFVSGSVSERRQSDEWAWVDLLPHSGAEEVHLGPLVDARRASGSTFVVVVESLDAVPADATVVVAADSASRVTVLRHPRLTTPFRLEGEFVSLVQADALRERLARRSFASSGVAYELPSSVTAADLEAMSGEAGSTLYTASPRGLLAAVGVSETGDVFTLDIVEQGPHAVVAGTTGSGKSELLVTWVTALAGTYDSSSFTVLLVDFKGGAAFDSLTELDQCVGLITDLDPRGAERALTSLRAEIRRRERLLRDSGARDISDSRVVGRLPRLMIVVDEFAAMLSEFPQLHDVFADIAARGRSLGMHLVLCTQRPSGVVRDSLLANCELRLSLRVNNAADSTAIIGSPAASMLSPEHRGRCLVSLGGRPPIVVQIAHTEAGGGAVVRAHPASTRVQSPWLPPLPGEIMLDSLARPTIGYALGLLDLPEEQRQPLAVYDPNQHGPLLILGSSGSGKSTLLSTIACQATTVITVGPGIEQSWDALREIVAILRRRQGGDQAQSPVTVLVDDVDSLLRRFEPEYQAEVASDLAMILRDGPRCGIALVVAAQRLAAPLTALAPLFPERIHLRFASRQEYIVAEGIASDHDPSLPPGAGHWRGRRLQVAAPASSALTPDPSRSRLDAPSPRQPPSRLLVVASRPAPFFAPGNEAVPRSVRLVDVSDRAALAAFSPTTTEPVWLVGSPDAWIAAWTTFSSLRSEIPVYFDGCSLGDFRSLARRRDLPPPVEHGRSARWLLTPDGEIVRFDVSDGSVWNLSETKRIS